ncbi:hypothetical protein, partial [Burkholderia ubonensis]|uniref:hypothetical protein n=1 Tax=Burkholderia ubonensis TaxID=101571 RepID=UPI001E3A4B05
MRCHENGRSRGARRREYWRIRKERNAASGRSRGNPKLKKTIPGECPKSPVWRRRSSLVWRGQTALLT